jgi:uncharacterized protein YbjQ (UPF0145 family)
MDKSMTTTTFTLDGYQVKKNLGVVRGIVVRSGSVFGTIGGNAAYDCRGKYYSVHRTL